jgi:hypothetical protein
MPPNSNARPIKQMTVKPTRKLRGDMPAGWASIFFSSLSISGWSGVGSLTAVPPKGKMAKTF